MLKPFFPLNNLKTIYIFYQIDKLNVHKVFVHSNPVNLKLHPIVHLAETFKERQLNKKKTQKIEPNFIIFGQNVKPDRVKQQGSKHNMPLLKGNVYRLTELTELV